MSVVVTLALTIATLGALAGPAAATPSAWDHRILPLVKFVQKARKLEFTHPIPVEFLSDAAFKKRVRHDDAKVTASDRRDAKRYVGELRALGLLQGNVDLIGAEKDLSGVDTLGYYDQDAKKMVIRGKDLADVATRVHRRARADPRTRRTSTSTSTSSPTPPRRAARTPRSPP